MNRYKIKPQLKEQILLAIKTQGLSVYQVAKQYDVSPKTIYIWLKEQPLETRQLKKDYLRATRENMILKDIVADLAARSKLKKKI